MFTGRLTHVFVGQITFDVDAAPIAAGNQPMSRISPRVRSRLVCRSGLIAGSMRAFGDREMSQWETEDPLANGLGVYILIRLLESAPACSTGSRRIVTFTPLARLALMRSEEHTSELQSLR